jgi:tetratricopeptide (TPR) repeat protein
VIGWRGKLLVYNGDDVEGRKLLMQAIQLDPDNSELKLALKNIRKQNDLKDEASELFKSGKTQEAIEKFKECLTIDPLNIHYNATI